MQKAGRFLFMLLTLIVAGCDPEAQDNGGYTGTEMKKPSMTKQDHNGEGQLSSTPVLPAEVDPDQLKGIFGFADETGSRIIVAGEEEGQQEQLAQITHAIGENGVVLPVTYDTWQRGDGAGSGRDTSYNFAHLSGDIFTVTEGTAQPNATYYLFQPQDIPLDSLLNVVTDGRSVMDEPLREKLESEKDRTIRQLWSLVEVGSDAKLYLALFQPDGKNQLFSFVLVRDHGVVVLDYPAVAEDTNSVWRVDDQGEVTPEMFSFLFAAQTTGKGILIGLEWYGAEGINVLFLHGEKDRLIELETRYGRYTAPL
ncbi:hypothetical protein POTG_03461 [Paenibacillus sp. oral taxon 786 str. D14]|nr:hypothetical protein POTG_03461 [Paenibacillus sp. oral taxon 786 str. D14]